MAFLLAFEALVVLTLIIMMTSLITDVADFIDHLGTVFGHVSSLIAFKANDWEIGLFRNAIFGKVTKLTTFIALVIIMIINVFYWFFGNFLIFRAIFGKVGGRFTNIATLFFSFWTVFSKMSRLFTYWTCLLILGTIFCKVTEILASMTNYMIILVLTILQGAVFEKMIGRFTQMTLFRFLAILR